MYVDLLNKYAQNIDFFKLQQGVTDKEIDDAEKKLNLLFPDELKDFLHETNGDNFLCLSINHIVEYNLENRRDIKYADPDLKKFLFIATNGCGDYYGYQIKNGTIQSTSIYIWDHEEAEARIVATNIANLIELYYQNQI